LLDRHVFLGNNASIASDDVVIEDSIIMYRCFMRSKNKIVNSIVGRHVRVSNNIVIEDSISITNSKIWPNKVIKSSLTIKNALIS